MALGIGSQLLRHRVPFDALPADYAAALGTMLLTLPRRLDGFRQADQTTKRSEVKKYTFCTFIFYSQLIFKGIQKYFMD